MSFSDYMSMRFFLPTGMFDSSYTLDTRIRNRLVTFYEVDGTVAKHFHYTATGAASLYTTALDMTRFLHALSIPAESGGLLSDETFNAMLASEEHVFGLPIWGLGVTRFIPGESTEVVVGQNGLRGFSVGVRARWDWYKITSTTKVGQTRGFRFSTDSCDSNRCNIYFL